MMTASFLSGGLAVTAFLVLVQLAARLAPKAAPVAVYFGTGMAVHLGATAIAAASLPAFSYWHAAALYWFGFMAYLFVFGAIYKSISLKILRALWQAPGHALAVAEITGGVVLPSFTDRVQVLLDGGLIEATPEGYRITAQGQKIAGRIAAVHRFFGIDRCGFYDH